MSTARGHRHWSLLYVQCRVMVIVSIVMMVGVRTTGNLFARGTGWTGTESGGCHRSGDNTGIELRDDIVIVVVGMVDVILGR